jgi:hypothetical protein
MKPLMHLLVGIFVVLLRETNFMKKKWAQVLDMSHGIDLAGVEAACAMEGLLDKGRHGLVWSSSSVKEVHRAVEDAMMNKMNFTIIEYVCTYGNVSATQINCNLVPLLCCS